MHENNSYFILVVENLYNYSLLNAIIFIYYISKF